MNNDERIRKWRESRGDEFDPAAEFAPAEKARFAAPRAERPAPSSSYPSDGVEDARNQILMRRRARWHLFLRRIGLFLALPALIVLLYVELIATPLYQGEAVFTVQTSGDSAASPSAGLFAIGGGGSTIADAFKAREFILSRPMMDYMQKRYGFLDHFDTYRMDVLTRYDSPLGFNRDPFNYYLKRVKVAVDVQEGLLRLYVQARTQQDAIRFGNAILAAAEAHTNQVSQKISEDQISALTVDVQNAERQVADTRRSLAAVQAQRGELSPEQAATSIYQLISQLELQRAEAQRERDGLLDQGLTNSPLLPRLDARVSELNAQIAEQKRRLVNPTGGSLVSTINQFEGASAKKEIAQARWQSTLNTLQQAYLRILEQRRYFVIIVGIAAPTFPAVRDILGIAIPLLLLLAFVYGLVFALRAAGVNLPDVRRLRFGR
jgi:capsular polysaccharide transport system permease protein